MKTLSSNKIKFFLSCCFCMFFTSQVKSSVGEVHADGGAWLIDELHTFYDGNDAYGFARFAKGFTAKGDLSLNLLFPVDGPMTLSDNGEVTLDGNLTLNPDASLPNGARTRR